MKKLLIFFILFIHVISNDYCASKQNVSRQQSDSTKPKTVSAFDTIWISCVGDLMCHEAELKDAFDGNGGYNFTHFYDIITPHLSRADITLGNLETVLAGSEKRFTGYPAFNSPDEFAAALKAAGFDILTTANNHCLDRSFYGVERTLAVLDEYGFKHTGTFDTEEKSREVLIVDVKGIKLAILAYTYGTNGIQTPPGKEFSVNYIDIDKIKSDITKAKALKADKIIICLHWGAEYQRMPNNNQINIADALFEAGADVIFGSHPHVIQPMETRTIADGDGKSRKVFIVYSMGNFISNQRKKYTDSGVIINLQLVKDNVNNTTLIGEINYVPTYVATQGGSFKIVPVQEVMYAIENDLSNSMYYYNGISSRINEVWNETTSHLTNRESDIYPDTISFEINK
jgi:poly-gamma-glutamate synthesis protein (capsule biosynthesis protein)